MNEAKAHSTGSVWDGVVGQPAAVRFGSFDAYPWPFVGGAMADPLPA